MVQKLMPTSYKKKLSFRNFLAAEPLKKTLPAKADEKKI
jgi:hypothetical protein